MQNKSNKSILPGNNIIPDMEIKDSEIDHLRRLLAWLSCEYFLDESMQQGALNALEQLRASGLITEEQANEQIEKRVKQVSTVPAYVRQAVKILQKRVRTHEKQSGVIDAQ